MGLFDRFRSPRSQQVTPQPTRSETRELAAEIDGWRERHPGAEAWIEEPNDFNPASMVLVAADGDSRRWRVPDVPWAAQWCRHRKIVFHRAGIEPYPQRMRDFNARQRRIEQQIAAELDGEV